MDLTRSWFISSAGPTSAPGNKTMHINTLNNGGHQEDRLSEKAYAPGPDGLSPFFIKDGDEMLTSNLTNVVGDQSGQRNRFLRTGVNRFVGSTRKRR